MPKKVNCLTNHFNKGFTIVELLVVIVIIGILAAIIAVSYTNITSKANLASIKSDLNNAHKQLALFQLDNQNENYPSTINCTGDTTTNRCLKSSEGTSYEYRSDTNPKSFCLSATKNNQINNIDQDGYVLAGACPVLNLNVASRLSYPATGSTWYDLSGYENNSTLTNGVVYNSSNDGVLNFDGIDDYVDSGSNLEWPGALTVESWHKRSVKDLVDADSPVGNWDWKPAVADRRGWTQRYYINSDVFQFIIEVTDGASIQELQIGYPTNTGVWYHTVSVFDPTDRTIKLYINGILQASGTAMNGFNQIAYNSQYPMYIGYNPVNNGFFNGQIGSVRIYNKALNASEINNNFESQRNRYGL